MKDRYAAALFLAAACTGLPASAQAAGQVVDVTLRDFRIDMPHLLPPGPTTFRVVNAGLADHNLELRGQGIDARLAQDLPAGRQGTFRVNLRPGAYSFRCPVPGHAEAGMQGKLVVAR